MVHYFKNSKQKGLTERERKKREANLSGSAFEGKKNVSTHYVLPFGRKSNVFIEKQAGDFHDLVPRQTHKLRPTSPQCKQGAITPYTAQLSKSSLI